tara:strand:+ start:118 stop:834 length:717 start_codon:yes stop_codon:yes gene_type:complete
MALDKHRRVESRGWSYYPYGLFIVMAVLFEVGQFDLSIADWLYRQQGHEWALKNAFIFKTVLHEWVRFAFIVLACSWILKMLIELVFFNRQRWLPTVYLFGSVMSTVLLVALLKKWTHVACPWHFTRYGGEVTYTSILHQIYAAQTNLACFPAGHASGGYALVALYFYFLMVNPKRRWLGLTLGLGLGLALDIGQQVRGAHFTSHGLWTLAIAWTIANIGYVICQPYSHAQQMALEKQ